jgi:hypothetical protein
MKGGWEMINIDNLSKQILFIYKIINSEMDSWSAIGKHWLQKYDIVYFKYIISQK